MRVLLAILVLFIVVSGAIFVFTSRPKDTNDLPSRPEIESLVNTYRLLSGVSVLTHNDDLQVSAQIIADKISLENAKQTLPEVPRTIDLKNYTGVTTHQTISFFRIKDLAGLKAVIDGDQDTIARLTASSTQNIGIGISYTRDDVPFIYILMADGSSR